MCYACFRGSFINSRLRGVCCCCCLVIKSWPTLCDPMEYSPPGSSCLWDFPGKNTGVGCHFLFQGIFLTRRVVWWAQNIFLCPVSMQPHLTIFCISLIFTSQREKRVALCGSETWQNPGILPWRNKVSFWGGRKSRNGQAPIFHTTTVFVICMHMMHFVMHPKMHHIIGLITESLAGLSWVIHIDIPKELGESHWEWVI